MAVGTPGKVLIIDDDPDLMNIYTEVLKHAGYIVDGAKDGQEGYGKILQGGYDLILLDIMIPKIDGLAILRKLKEKHPEIINSKLDPSASSYHGSIIVLSALNQEEVIKSALGLGAKGYIVKSSITPGELLSKVSQILRA